MSDSAFQYFLNQKKHVAVVSFLGNPGRKDIDQIAKCYDLIQSLTCQVVIFNFGGVTGFEEDLNPALVRLQQCVREGNRELLICGLMPEIKKRLVESGIIRSYESVETLVEALQKIVGKKSGGGK